MTTEQLILHHLAYSPLGVVAWDASYRIIRWDGAAERIFGWTAEEIIGQRIDSFPLIYDDDFEQVTAIITQLSRAQERTIISRNRNWTKDGKVRHCEWYNTALVDENGAMTSVLSFVVDRTEQAEAEIRLQASQSRLRVLAAAGLRLGQSLDYDQTLAEVAELVVSSSLADYCVLDVVNPSTGALERVVAVHRDPDKRYLMDLLKRNPALRDENLSLRAFRERRVFTESRGLTDQFLRRVTNGDEHFDTLRALGVKSVLMVPLVVGERAIGTLNFASASVIEYDTETITFAEELARRCAVAIDHALIFALERRLRVEREEVSRRLVLLQLISTRFSKATSVTEVAVVGLEHVLPHLGAIAGAVFVQDGARIRMLHSIGYPEDLNKKYTFMHDVPSAVTDAMRDDCSHYYRDAQAHDGAYPHLAADTGKTGYQGLAVLPLRTGGVLGVLTIRFAQPRDFSDADRRLLESVAEQCAQALARARLLDAERAARAEADHANQAKDEFLAMLGHELRNPLAPLATAAYMLRQRGAPSKETAIIERQVAHLSRLVDDLLDVARIASGKIELKQVPLDMHDIVTAAVENVSPVLEQRKHALDVQLPDKKLPVMGDHARLVQVLSNLLTNAAKYTDPGGRITVTGSIRDNRLALSVTDTGVGFPPDMSERVFDMFVQAAQARDRAQGGLGIGLTIVRRMVELHGGRVRAHSEGPGKGAEFTLELPLCMNKTETIVAAPNPTVAGQSVKVLVVDDNKDAAEMLFEILHEQGYAVRIAYDGPSALEVCRSFEPKIALLDVGLPVMDGYELGKLLRAKLGPSIRLVAVTGYGRPRDIFESQQARFDAHLIKPVAAQTLLGEVGRLARSDEQIFFTMRHEGHNSK